MLGAIVARLTAAGLRTSVAEDLDAITKGTAPAAGAVFVIPYRESASPNALATGGHRQAVEMRVIVAHVVRFKDDIRGAERAAAFDAPKALTEQALAGWEPDPAGSGMDLVSGEGQALGNGVSVYAQVWRWTRWLSR